MVPSATKSPEASRPAPGSNLAKEGAQTIEELLTVAFQSLNISGTSPSSDSSDNLSTPPQAEPMHSSTGLGTFMPESCSVPAEVTLEQAAALNELAYSLFSGCDLWALEYNTIPTPFARDRSPSSMPIGTNSWGEIRPPFPPLAEDPPTQTDSTTAAPRNVVPPTPEDLGFAHSLSSMFGQIQNAHPMSPAPIPISVPSTPAAVANSGTADGTAPMQASPFAAFGADPQAWSREGTQDAGLWQWCTAPDGEL